MKTLFPKKENEGRQMKIVQVLEAHPPAMDCAIALGNFDGLHVGHVRVIRAAVNSPGLHGAVFTFQENSHQQPGLLMRADKEALIAEIGVERLYSVSFEEVRDLSPEVFFREILLKRCGAKKLCCGKDFRFGKEARGSVERLERLCGQAGIELEVVPYVSQEGERVSSTGIRKAIQEGDLARANRMLGRPFGFVMEVIHGNHIGRKLGTPTVNQALPQGFLLPRFGVYVSVMSLRDRGPCGDVLSRIFSGAPAEDSYYGVTNIGVKPTVGSDRVLAETWMPEYTGAHLYGKKLRLYLYRFLRPERKFGSLEEMKTEILKNAAEAKAFLQGDCERPSGLLAGVERGS